MEKKQKECVFFDSDFLSKNQRGQITIFIIVAVVIIALVVLLYLLFPKIKVNFGFATDNPSEFIQNCMGNTLREVINNVSSQGGSLNPEHYFLYNNSRVNYLCYTNKYYTPCVIQQALLKQHVEIEIKKGIKTKSASCFDSLIKNFESQGFKVNLEEGNTSVELIPKRVVVVYNKKLSLTKDSTKRYDKIVILVDNNLYELTSITDSILSMETKYGDSETTVYMNYYHNLEVEKKKQTDGTTIYILTNRESGNKFRFASRSIAWPPGIEQPS